MVAIFDSYVSICVRLKNWFGPYRLMPYLLSSWAQQLQQGGGGSGVSKGKTIRTIPHDNANKGATQDNNKNPESDKSKSDKIEKSQLNSMINIIRTQVDDIFRNPPCASTEDESFYRYTLSVEMVIFSGKFSNIYLAHHQDHPEFALVGRVYEPTSKIEPSKSIYMKILRHLGKFELTYCLTEIIRFIL